MKINILTGIVILIGVLSGIAQERPPHGGRFGQGGQMPKECTLTGKIIESGTGNVVQYANIVLYSMRDSSIVDGAVADENGIFFMDKLPYGRFQVEVNFIGYEKLIIPKIMLTPKQKDLDLGSIKIKQAVTELQEVEIVEDRQHIEYKIDKKVVNVSQDIMSSNGSAVDVLENVPSLETDIEGNVSLRGSSSFTVLIDGKPSVLEGSDALKQIPASSIENIEIITNPSAKYDPDGVAGIINVILKKKQEKGINGLINAKGGTDGSYGLDFLFNYRISKFNIFAGADYHKRTRPGTGHKESESYFNDTTYFIDANSDRDRGHGGYGVKGGFDYYLNDMNTISLSGDYGQRGFEMSRKGNYHEYTLPATVDEYYIMENDFDVDHNYYSLTSSYQHKFDKKGHELLLTGYYSDRGGEDYDYSDQYYTDENWVLADSFPVRQRTIENDASIKTRIKADYTKPMGKHNKLEAGYQYRNYFGESEQLYESFDNDANDWIEEDSLYNNIDFTRDIHSAYSTFSGFYGGFEFLLGFRTEYTDRIIKQIVTNEEYIVDRFDFFPSLHLSRSMSETQEVQASYSRRIRRPREWHLDPFISYIDPQNIRAGNPGLEPEYTDSYELNFQKRFKSSFVTLEGYYRHTSNMISRIRVMLDNNILMHTSDNVGEDHAFGVELMGNVEIKKWWQINASGTAFRYMIDGEVYDESVEQATNTWNLRLNNTFKMPWGTRVQISGRYRGPSLSIQGERGAYYVVNAAVKQDFLKNTLSATIQVRDIFDTWTHYNTSEGNNFYLYTEHSMKSPTLSFSLSYYINNYKPDRKQQNGEDGGYEGMDEVY